MKSAKKRRKKFKKYTKFIHKRSEGITHRRNKGTKLQEKDERIL